jgi:glycosyltransferase involved in cell wall biosynthesis
LYQQFIRRGSRRPAPRRLLVITEALLRKLRVQFEPQFGCQLEPQLVEDLQNIDVQIAPNGVDLSQYEDLPDAPAARRRLNLPERITVVYSGHFYAGRGMDLLYGLAKRFAQVQFLWIGGREEDVSAWRSRLEAEKMENVILTGFLSQRVLPLYQAAGDILLMPYERSIAGSSGGNSADICSPMKMFDYLAAGRVILSSDLPVFHEILNETNAVFAPPQALEAWSQALQALIDDEPLRLRLSAQARQDARKYTWQERASRAIQNF